MSVTSTRSTTLVHSKPDKNTSPTLADTVSTTSQAEVIPPTTPIPPIEKTANETANDTLLLPKSPEESAESLPQIENAVEKLNGFMVSMKRDLEFSFDKQSNRTIVTVGDATTQEIVRQLPSEAALKLAKVLQETKSLDNGALGQLLDVRT